MVFLDLACLALAQQTDRQTDERTDSNHPDAFFCLLRALAQNHYTLFINFEWVQCI